MKLHELELWPQVFVFQSAGLMSAWLGQTPEQQESWGITLRYQRELRARGMRTPKADPWYRDLLRALAAEEE